MLRNLAWGAVKVVPPPFRVTVVPVVTSELMPNFKTDTVLVSIGLDADESFLNAIHGVFSFSN